MKVSVISDSHDNMEAVEKAVEIMKDKGIKVVFHLGDIISPFVLKKFSGFEYYGVFGNNDGEKLLLKKIAEESGMKIDIQPHILEFQDKKFLLYHGSGSVEKTRKIVENFANSGEYDFVLYGHTHIVDIRNLGKTLILNPGESCGYLSGKRTFAILDVVSGDVEIIEF